jgi:hypothetical protein
MLYVRHSTQINRKFIQLNPLTQSNPKKLSIQHFYFYLFPFSSTASSFHSRLNPTYIYSNEAQRKYSELHHKMEALMQQVEEAKKSPTSKYDSLIYKQNCVNDTVAKQVCPYFHPSLSFAPFIADKPFSNLYCFFLFFFPAHFFSRFTKISIFHSFFSLCFLANAMTAAE